MQPSVLRTASLAIACCAAWIVPRVASAEPPVILEQFIGPTIEDIESVESCTDLSFGAQVEIFGNTAMVGMSGRVAVFTRRDDAWQRTSTLLPGGSVALGANKAVIGTNFGGVSALYLFARHGGAWREVASSESHIPSSESVSTAVVAYDRGTIVHGITSYSSETGVALPGSVYILEHDHRGNLRTTARLQASDGFSGDGFGVSVALDGKVLVVGAPYNGAGAAYVFVREGQRWTERAKLVGSDVQLGDPFGGVEDLFGTAVAVRDGAIIVSAPHHDLPGQPFFSPEGQVYVFLRDRGGWFESQKLNDGRFFASIGESVAMGKGLVAVNAPFQQPVDRTTSNVFLFEWVGQELVPMEYYLPVPRVDAGADLDFWQRRLIVGNPGEFFGACSAIGDGTIVEFGAPDDGGE